MRVLPQSTSAAILNEAKAVKYYVHLNLKKKENKLSVDRILKWQLDPCCWHHSPCHGVHQQLPFHLKHFNMLFYCTFFFFFQWDRERKHYGYLFSKIL